MCLHITLISLEPRHNHEENSVASIGGCQQQDVQPPNRIYRVTVDKIEIVLKITSQTTGHGRVGSSLEPSTKCSLDGHSSSQQDFPNDYSFRCCQHSSSHSSRTSSIEINQDDSISPRPSGMSAEPVYIGNSGQDSGRDEIVSCGRNELLMLLSTTLQSVLFGQQPSRGKGFTEEINTLSPCLSKLAPSIFFPPYQQVSLSMAVGHCPPN